MRFRTSFLAIVGLVLVTLLAACGQSAAPASSPAKPSSPAASASSPAASASQSTSPSASASAAGSPKPAVQPLSPPVKVTYGTIGTLGAMGVHMAMYRGYFKEEGLDVEYMPFKTSTDQIPALAQGQLDVGSGAINAGLFNAIARDINLRLVAEPSTVDNTEGLVVRKDLADQIKDWKDLKGRKVALSSTASSVELNVDKALEKGGLTLKDISVETMGFPDMLVALSNKAVDVAYLTEPSISQGIAQGILVKWKMAGEMNPDHQVGVIMYSAKFAQERPEAAKRFMAAIVRGSRDYADFLKTGQGKQDVINAAIQNTTIKDPKTYETMVWSGVNPDLTLRTKSIQNDLEWYAKKDYVKQAPDLKVALDESFTKYALDRLGPYKR